MIFPLDVFGNLPSKAKPGQDFNPITIPRCLSNRLLGPTAIRCGHAIRPACICSLRAKTRFGSFTLSAPTVASATGVRGRIMLNVKCYARRGFKQPAVLTATTRPCDDNRPKCLCAGQELRLRVFGFDPHGDGHRANRCMSGFLGELRKPASIGDHQFLRRLDQNLKLAAFLRRDRALAVFVQQDVHPLLFFGGQLVRLWRGRRCHAKRSKG